MPKTHFTSYRSVPIDVDSTNGWFSATVNDEYFEEDGLRELEKKLGKAIDRGARKRLNLECITHEGMRFKIIGLTPKREEIKTEWDNPGQAYTIWDGYYPVSEPVLGLIEELATVRQRVADLENQLEPAKLNFPKVSHYSRQLPLPEKLDAMVEQYNEKFALDLPEPAP